MRSTLLMLRNIALLNALLLIVVLSIPSIADPNFYSNSEDLALFCGFSIALFGIINWLAGFFTLIISLAKPRFGKAASALMLFGYTAIAGGAILICLNADALPV